jgi:hypothetical protein
MMIFHIKKKKIHLANEMFNDQNNLCERARFQSSLNSREKKETNVYTKQHTYVYEEEEKEKTSIQNENSICMII